MSVIDAAGATAPADACSLYTDLAAQVRESGLLGPAQIDFLRRQVLMSRNVRGGPMVDFALGGLNYQIEHHFFSSMPRPNLNHVGLRARGPFECPITAQYRT